MLLYDNLEDVKQKLFQSYVMYAGDLAYVSDVKTRKGKYVLALKLPDAVNYKWVELDDPNLNYMEFNLGYANYGPYGCAWWCRIPYKQWKQGLLQSQMKYFVSKESDLHPSIGFNEGTADMLKNKYPKFDDIWESVQDGTYASRAFHKDFAISWNPLHKDFILDYKGKSIGHMKNKMDFVLMDEFLHLEELVQEVVNQ